MYEVHIISTHLTVIVLVQSCKPVLNHAVYTYSYITINSIKEYRHHLFSQKLLFVNWFGPTRNLNLLEQLPYPLMSGSYYWLLMFVFLELTWTVMDSILISLTQVKSQH